MRRVIAESLISIHTHGIAIDPAKWEVRVEGRPVSLTSGQFRLLHFLARNAGRVFTRQEIIGHLHGPDREVTEHCIDAQIFTIRKKLGSHRHLVQTVRNVGYGFQTQRTMQQP